jgi:hypothetical protein
MIRHGRSDWMMRHTVSEAARQNWWQRSAAKQLGTLSEMEHMT